MANELQRLTGDQGNRREQAGLDDFAGWPVKGRW